MNEKAENILEAVFGEVKKPAFKGRQDGPRRPERSKKSGYKGRGYSGPGGAMKGRDVEIEPGAKKSKPREVITEFDSVEDWILSMILVSVMHVNPGIDSDAAIKIGKEWVKKLYMPRSGHVWKKQTARINRYGVRAEASKIRRELFKLI